MFGISFEANATSLLESAPEAVDHLEIDATGFFSRSSPYLRWLAARYQISVRASALSVGSPGPLNADRLQSLANVGSASNCRFIILPLGFRESGAIQLGTTVPISLTESSLELVAEHVAAAARRCDVPALVEPIAGPLRVPGSLAETDFLNRMCRKAGCRLLIDVTTLLVASRNLHFDPRPWLLEVDGRLIAAARITGCRNENGRWRTDPRTVPDQEAWVLMRDLAAHARPDVLFLAAHEPASGIDGLRRDLQRLRDVVGAPHVMPGIQKNPNVSQGAVAPKLRTPASPRVVTTQTSDGSLDSVTIAPDASLFVLDDAGVFFSSTRQELSLFNTAATLIWCLIEERRSTRYVVKAYQQAFSVDDLEATRHVSAILQQWFALGYISNPNLATAPEVPLTTALAQVLTNAQLRSQFRHARHELADALHLAQEDVDSFVRLDPDELDAQAEDVAALRAPRRTGLLVSPNTLHERENTAIEHGHQRLVFGAARGSRRFRLLKTTFEVWSDSGAFDAQLDEALAHLECSESDTDVVFKLRLSDSGSWNLFAGTALVECDRRSEQVIPALKRLVRETCVNRAQCAIRVHAAVVSFNGGCVLMPASAGNGKTTLTAALIRSGATYFSDEVALLEGELAVRPVPVALTIKEGSVEPLRRIYPGISALTSHLREDYQQVRYLAPPAASLPTDDGIHPVRWIVFPRYDPIARTTLRPLARSVAFKRLLDESIVDFERLDRSVVASLVQGMRNVACFEVAMSSLEQAVELFHSPMFELDS